MTFLNNQHLLVKFGDKLSDCIINKDNNIGKQLERMYEFVSDVM